MGRQRGATGGLGTASGSNREASMYVCMPAAWPYNAFSRVPLMDIESSLRGVSSETGTLLSEFNVEKSSGSKQHFISFCFAACIVECNLQCVCVCIAVIS